MFQSIQHYQWCVWAFPPGHWGLAASRSRHELTTFSYHGNSQVILCSPVRHLDLAFCVGAYSFACVWVQAQGSVLTLIQVWEAFWCASLPWIKNTFSLCGLPCQVCPLALSYMWPFWADLLNAGRAWTCITGTLIHIVNIPAAVDGCSVTSAAFYSYIARLYSIG